MVMQIGRLDEPVSFPKDNSEWHSFLQGNVEDALAVRDYVKSLPETAATFTLKQINDQLNRRLQNLPEGIVKLTGAWAEPEEIRELDRRRWVNPNHIHAQHYSDALTMCDCGVPVLRQNFGEEEPQPSHHQEHNADCNKIQRLESRLQLLKNRQQIVRDGYQYGHPVTALTQRLGYEPSSEIGGRECENWGLDITELGIESRKRIARTCMVLCRNYSTGDVGKLFGLHRKSISEILKHETKSSPKSLYSVRRSLS